MDAVAGFIGDAAAFASIWEAFQPGAPVPSVDFGAQLVLFARNTQFYNRLSIGQVSVKMGVAGVLAMETLSSAPITDKAAMALVVVSRQGIRGVRAGDRIVPVGQ